MFWTFFPILASVFDAILVITHIKVYKSDSENNKNIKIIILKISSMLLISLPIIILVFIGLVYLFFPHYYTANQINTLLWGIPILIMFWINIPVYTSFNLRW